MKIRATIEWEIPTHRLLSVAERERARENTRLQLERLGATIESIELIDA